MHEYCHQNNTLTIAHWFELLEDSRGTGSRATFRKLSKKDPQKAKIKFRSSRTQLHGSYRKTITPNVEVTCEPPGK